MKNEQKRSIILGTIGMLLTFMLLVEGESVWLWMHTHMLGWLGIGSAVLPVMLLYMAGQEVQKKPKNVILSVISFSFLETLVFLIGADSEGISLGIRFTEAFDEGVMFTGSGAFGSLLGTPFLIALGKAGGILICVLCLTVSLLFFFDIPLFALLERKPQKSMRQSHRTPVRTEPVRVSVPVTPEYNYVPEYHPKPAAPITEREYPRNLVAMKIVDALASFGIQATVMDLIIGSSVTRYEVQPAKGVRINNIVNLSDDIALALGVSSVRVEPVPQKTAVGIEVPNETRGIVTLQEMVESAAFRTAYSNKLAFCLGKDIGGNQVLPDLSAMPHLLIGGTTGSGKSVCVNSLILSILQKAKPSDVRFVLIDPKKVELIAFEGIPHLLTPVVTEAQKAAGALAWAVKEMEDRYRLFVEQSVRNIEGYNQVIEGTSNRLPQIVIVIDEFADLIQTAPKAVEDAVCRLAQKARAAGIHMVIATQRPTTNIITGTIKANIPSRIALYVSSQNESRTILDAGGAKKLLGNGDMLFSPVGCQNPMRLQGCFASDSERDAIIQIVRRKWKGGYSQVAVEEIERLSKPETLSFSEFRQDPLLEQAVRIVTEEGQASVSLLQRKLRIGQPRAGSLLDALATDGVVSGYAGSKPRSVLVDYTQWKAKKAAS